MARRSVIPEFDLARIQRFCAGRVPLEFAEEIRVEHEVRGRSVTILECRPPWRPPPTEWTRKRVAQLRHDDVAKRWRLYWADRNGRWHPYVTPESGHVDDLLKAIDEDATGIFWG